MQHHATLVRSTDSLVFVPKEEVSGVIYYTFDRIGVDEVKSIATASTLRPTEGVEQLFVLRTLFVTHEAQNALLKLFEEPPAGLSFLLVVPESFQLLPTLMSRFGSEIAAGEVQDTKDWDDFCAATPADRLKQIDSWNKTKDAAWLQSMVRGVQSVEVSSVRPEVLPALLLAGEKLATRGASNKMLLEHLALALPLRKQ